MLIKLPRALLVKYPEIMDWSILTLCRGSIAHGLYLPSSAPTSIDDKDILAVSIPPLNYYFGLEEYGSRGTKEIKEGVWDIVVYEFKKAVRLLIQGNPNILCILWTDKDCYLKISPEGQQLLSCRELFVGRHIYRSFVGYAQGQLHRMTHLAFQGYMGEKRKRLVNQFGYDVKNAAHLIRLLRMAIEFLKEGRLYVKRPDYEELLSIKRGEWSLKEVKKEAKRLFKLAKIAYLKSKLPETLDYNKINKLCISILIEYFNKRKNSFHFRDLNLCKYPKDR